MANAWHPANNGTGPRMWFVYREADAVRDRYAWDARGLLRRFGSHDAAARVARTLNETEGLSGNVQ